jgi:hypothetical protein
MAKAPPPPKDKKAKKTDKKETKEKAEKETKKATTKKESKSKTTKMDLDVKQTTSTKTKPKKTYTKLGQTKDAPPPTDSLRIFYTSLFSQNPNSKMAMKWCLERGLLSEKDAQEAILVLEMEAKAKV